MLAVRSDSQRRKLVRPQLLLNKKSDARGAKLLQRCKNASRLGPPAAAPLR